MEKSRLWFLQASRGIACLLIVYVHWVAFLINPNGNAQSIYQMPIPGTYQSPSVVEQVLVLARHLVCFNFREVYFGLGLFFLISGFVIPLSMGKSSQIEFLFRRIFRIYPVVIVTTVLTVFLVFFARTLDGNATDPLPFSTVLANIFLVRDLVQHQFVDAALWTLEVEMHFYLVCFVIGFFNGHKKAIAILGVATFFCLTAYYSGRAVFVNTRAGVLLEIAAANSGFITLMLMGTTLFNRVFNAWSFNKTALTIVFLLLANKFCLNMYHGYGGETGEIIYSNHILAILFFIAMMLEGDRLPYSKTLDRLAEVSYPLYLLHGAGAYSVFYAVYKLTCSTLLSFSVAAVVTVALTLLVHTYVEKKAIKLGHIIWLSKPKPVLRDAKER